MFNVFIFLLVYIDVMYWLLVQIRTLMYKLKYVK